MARSVGKELVAEPDTSHEALIREKPREPLSPLSQALPLPEPEITLFYRPVATGSASFDSMGYKLAIAGTESIGPDENCTTGSIVWPCGTRARTAVRMWLRGRALTCKPPPKNKDAVAVVECSLGKQDVGAWLVSNGWARAAADGPYTKAEARARDAGMGIFGLPPRSFRLMSPNRPHHPSRQRRRTRHCQTRSTDAPRASADTFQAASSPASALSISARVSAMP